MPCNDSGFYDPAQSGKFGIADFDWSDAKQIWANAKPMSCEEVLVTQASMVKAYNPDARVFVCEYQRARPLVCSCAPPHCPLTPVPSPRGRPQLRQSAAMVHVRA